MDSSTWLKSEDRAKIHIASCINKVIGKIWNDDSIVISSNLKASSKDDYNDFCAAVTKELMSFKEKQQAIVRLKPVKLDDAVSYVKSNGWICGSTVKVDKNTTLVRCIKDCGGTGNSSGTAVCEVIFDGEKSILIFYYIHMEFNEVKSMLNSKPE